MTLSKGNKIVEVDKIVMSAPLPNNEINRVLTLQNYNILDTPPEVAFDHVTKMAAHYLHSPLSFVTFIDADRQWIKSCFGVDMQQSDRKLSFCAHAILSNKVMIVSNALSDSRFRDNPLVSGEPHIRAYAGAPL
ncbi:MAG: GAF domain-containing protein, partial [Proteobacteria bacterium]